MKRHLGMVVMLSAALGACAPEPHNSRIEEVQIRTGAATAPQPQTWADTKKRIGAIIGEAETISDAFSGITGTIDIGIKVATLLGLIKPPVDEVAELSKKLDGIATGLSWQISTSFRDVDYGHMLAAIDTMSTIIASHQQYTVQSSGFQDSVSSTSDAEQGSAFQRTFVESATNGLNLPVSFAFGTGTFRNVGWKGVVSARPPVANGLVYDWRLGVPIMMKLIALRLVIIAAADPNFRTDHLFDVELTQHRNALLAQYQNLRGALHCQNQDVAYGTLNYSFAGGFSKAQVMGCNVVCADIFTGAAAISTLQPPSVPTQPTGRVYTSTPCSKVDPQTIADTQNSLQWEASQLEALPTFQLRAMADLLWTFLHPAPDLTDVYGQFEADKAPSRVCMDIIGDSTDDPFEFLQVLACNGGDAQFWQYNRQTQQIRNPVTDTCVTTTLGLPQPGIPLFSLPCSALQGSPPAPADLTQQWTYDPELKRIQNPYGLVIAMDGSLVSGTTVSTSFPASPTGLFGFLYKYQAWHADVATDPFP